jgi:xylulokinase
VLPPGHGDVLCGVDIGTTYIKAALVTADGTVASVARAPTPLTSDGTGPCHDPEQIRLTAEKVMRQAQRSAAGPGGPARIAAVGITGVGEEGVPLGSRSEVLYPAIAWYERRPSEPERQWSARHPGEELFAVTGLHRDLGLTIFKWLWLKGTQPQVWSACRHWLGIADYAAWRWTGERGMSISHASRTGLFRLADFRWEQDWAAEVLARGTDALPPLHQAGSPVGRLRPGAIPGLLTTAEVPVVATGLDHTVGGYAAGLRDPGELLDSMGTAEALIEPVPAERVRDAGHTLPIDFGAGVLPGSHIAIAGFESGAGIGAMLRALGGSSHAGRCELESAAAGLTPGAGGLLYVPPRTRSRSGGALLGHQVFHEPAHFYRAVVEGWALAAGEALSALGEPGRLRDVVCIGGGAGSLLRAQVKASILDRQIRCLITPEIVAVGAALLAGEAAGDLGREAAAHWQPATTVVDPVPGWTEGYRALRAEFRRAAALIHPDAGPQLYP